MIVIGLIVVLVVAGAAVYYLVAAPPAPPAPTSTSHSSTSVGHSSTTPSSPSTTRSSTTQATGSSTLKTYSGTFNFSEPQGPFGELVYSNGTAVTYSSVLAASGSFTFSVNPNNFNTGTGSGQGMLTDTTTGFCSGRVTFPYTFQIPDVAPLGGNTTVFIGNPTPANFTVPLTCTATPSPGSSNGNTFPFLSIYPNELSVVAIPASVTQHLTGNINYQFTITPTN